MISLPSHTSHALQPLDVACFGPFKKVFRTNRDLWMDKGKGEKVTKDILAQWASLALQKALTDPIIRAGFRARDIYSLDFEAMNAKIKPSEIMQHIPHKTP